MRKKPGTTERPGAAAPRLGAGDNPSPANPTPERNPAGFISSKTIAASGPKSLMKTSELGAVRTAARRPGAHQAAAPQRRKSAPTNISGSRQQKIEERIAA